MKTDVPYLHVLRALSIIGVVIIHAFTLYSQPENSPMITILVRTIVSFTVPMFVMVSGALILNSSITSPSHFLKKRIERVGIPLLVWMIIHYLLHLSLNPEYNLYEYLMRYLLFGQPYYLLWVLLGLYLFTPFLKKLISALSQKEMLLLVGLLLSLSAASSTITQWLLAGNNILPLYTFNYFSLYLGYYLAGAFLHQHGKWTPSIWLLGLIVGLASMITFGLISAYGVSPKGLLLLDSLNPVVMLYTSCLFLLAKNGWIKRIGSKQVITLISSASFGIYFVHMPILSWLSLYIPSNGVKAVIAFGLSLIVVKLFSRVKPLSYWIGFA